MALLKVAGIEVEIFPAGSVYFGTDEGLDRDVDRRAEVASWYIRGEALTPGLHKALLGMRDQWAEMVRAFMQEQRVKLEDVRSRCNGFGELLSGSN